MQCTYHPRRETTLACNKCGKPICGHCVIQTPVGGRCKECARLRPLPQYQISLVFFLRGAGAALVVGVGMGFLLAFAVDAGVVPWRLRWLFFPIVLAATGYVVGMAASAATNRRQGPLLQAVAVGGFLAGVAAIALLAPGLLLNFYSIIGLLIGLALAVNPFR